MLWLNQRTQEPFLGVVQHQILGREGLGFSVWREALHLVLRSTLSTMIFCSRSYMWPDATVNTCTRSSASSPLAASPAAPAIRTSAFILDLTRQVGALRYAQTARRCFTAASCDHRWQRSVNRAPCCYIARLCCRSFRRQPPLVQHHAVLACMDSQTAPGLPLHSLPHTDLPASASSTSSASLPSFFRTRSCTCRPVHTAYAHEVHPQPHTPHEVLHRLLGQVSVMSSSAEEHNGCRLHARCRALQAAAVAVLPQRIESLHFGRLCPHLKGCPAGWAAQLPCPAESTPCRPA